MDLDEFLEGMRMAEGGNDYILMAIWISFVDSESPSILCHYEMGHKLRLRCVSLLSLCS